MFWCVLCLFSLCVQLNYAKDVKILELRITDIHNNSGQLSCKGGDMDVYVQERYQVRVHSPVLFKDAWYGTDLLKSVKMFKESNSTYLSETLFSHYKPGNISNTWTFFTKNCITSTSACIYQSRGLMSVDKGVKCVTNVRVHSADETFEKPRGYMTVNGTITGFDCKKEIEPVYEFAENDNITFHCYKTSKGGHVQLLLTTSDGKYRSTNQSNISVMATIHMRSSINGARVNCSIIDDHQNYCDITLKLNIIIPSNETDDNAIPLFKTDSKPTLTTKPTSATRSTKPTKPKLPSTKRPEKKKTTMKPMPKLTSNPTSARKPKSPKIPTTPTSTSQITMKIKPNTTPIPTSIPKQETTLAPTPTIIPTSSPKSTSTTLLSTAQASSSSITLLESSTVYPSSVEVALSAFTEATVVRSMEASTGQQSSSHKDDSNNNYLLWLLLPIILAAAAFAVAGYYVYRCRSRKTSNEPLVENVYEAVNCQTTTFINSLRIHEDGSRSPPPVPARNPSSDVPPDHHYDVAYNITTQITDVSTEKIYDVAYGITTQINESVPERTYDVVYEARIRRHGTAEVPEHMRQHCSKPNGDKLKRLL